jgi:uncharacterized membrane protein YhaH (DUF805 family)
MQHDRAPGENPPHPRSSLYALITTAFPPSEDENMPTLLFDPLIAAAVIVATACTDAVYVMFTNAVVRRKRLPAASWSGIWYLLGSFAVINYTHHWIYVVFAAAGSFIGAYVTMTFLHPGPVYPPPPVGSAAA